jgi:hypothetical protein
MDAHTPADMHGDRDLLSSLNCALEWVFCLQCAGSCSVPLIACAAACLLGHSCSAPAADRASRPFRT